ncbi:hypothetical protein D0C36_05375 [Mucilaginibacter conchicola]|uniref:Uncharacterized protein n=1 Tax=Mucilaginibacter conchicola TaxID=2303333 RepID=A0A372NZ64_9SPHI|nr:hypothetical protein [Mucilaginibacter conchicola]RFZ94959.1 hypothetical protein D0C36_05375 [Mucilaginibacter conchicola]
MIEQPKTLTSLYVVTILYLIFILINSLANFILPGYNFENNIFINVVLGAIKYIYMLVVACVLFALASLLRDYDEKQAIQTSFVVYGAMVILPNLVILLFNMSQKSFQVLGFINLAVVVVLCIMAFQVREPKISRYFKLIGLEILILHIANIVAPMILLPYINRTYNSYATLQLMYTVVFLLFATPIPITILVMVRNIMRAKPVFKMPGEFGFEEKK